MWNEPPSGCEYDRLRRLPMEEQAAVQRWVIRRMSRSWQMWVAISSFWLVSLVSELVSQVARGAGAGFAVIPIWVAFHSAYAATVARVCQPVHRRILCEFLCALDAHEKANGDSRQLPHIAPNSTP